MKVILHTQRKGSSNFKECYINNNNTRKKNSTIINKREGRNASTNFFFVIVKQLLINKETKQKNKFCTLKCVLLIIITVIDQISRSVATLLLSTH